MGYRVHGILQASILEWVAFPFSKGSSQPRDPTQVSCIAGGFFTNWATRETGMRTAPRTLKSVDTQSMGGCSVAAGVIAGDLSRKGMSLVWVVLKARGRGSSTFRQGNSLEVQWLGLPCFHRTERRFNPWSGNWDLTCQETKIIMIMMIKRIQKKENIHGP